MRNQKILVTGAAGLVGSAVCRHFHSLGYTVFGLDNNQRQAFFGEGGDTLANLDALKQALPGYQHVSIDVRDRDQLLNLFKAECFDVILHAAGQPSHDLAAKIPFDDFEINAVGTLNLLEACRQYTPESPFVFLSTNKVYGDRPNAIELREEAMRWEYADPAYEHGIDEMMSIDQSTHSLFGVSKAAADLMVQEYGRYFGMATCCLRAGCLTGAAHSGVKLHGFLNYLVRCAVKEDPYTIIGYKGKQVRDNLEAGDVARFVECFVANPRSAAVYNIGGGKENSCSVLEAIELVNEIAGKRMKTSYEANARVGDHICYYSDLRRLQQDYPEWTVRKSLRDIIVEIADAASR
jgi:CDP-paratose 2-epimerase